MIRHKQIEWVYYHGALVPDAPPHKDINLTACDQKKLLRLSGAYLLRYTKNWDTEKQTAFWYIIKDRFTGMDEFSRNTRNKIKRGLKHNLVRRAELFEMHEEGYAVYRKAFDRYHTHMKPMTEKQFRARYREKTTESYEYWAVINGISQKMVGFAEVHIMDQSAHLNMIKFHPDYLKSYTSYGLFYELLNHYLLERKLSYLSNYTRNVSHDTNIQNFLLEKFRFRKAYCTLIIRYRPTISFIIAIGFPFRKIIRNIPFAVFQKLSALLLQEEYRKHSLIQ
jgi:hypothetical protein